MKQNLVGIIYLFSLIFLTFIISFVMEFIHYDDREKIVREVLKRWFMLLGGIGAFIALLIVVEAVAR